MTAPRGRPGPRALIRMPIKILLLLACVMALAAASPLAVSNTQARGQEQQQQKQQQLDRLIQQAVQLRDSSTATPRDQSQSFALLLAAAGIKGSSAIDTADPPQALLALKHHTDTPPAVLRELANSFMLGAGVAADQQVATELYRAAAAAGDPEALGHWGLRLAYGLQDPAAAQGNAIKYFSQADEASAILHYTLAAAAGDKFSQGAMGYRHYTGLGVPKSCWTAVAYYQPLAEAVIDAALAAGGLPQIERLRLNLHANQGLRSERQREVLQYYQYSADRGNTEAQTTVGTVLIAGTHGLRDHAAAYHYLHRAAAAGDPEAMAHLGSMYAAGVGAPQDWKQALSWFQRSADKGNILAYYSLGYMYLSGKGVGLDADKALTYFTKAAEGGDRDAHFYLGVMYMQGLGVKRRSVNRAFMYFYTAAQAGHSQAMYNTAMMQLAGRGTQRSCRPAARLLKQLAEKGLVAVALQQGHEHFFRGQYAQALLFYLRAAEMGMELGQSNAAWMLDRGYGHAGPHAAAVATQLYRRSAEQGNVVSLLQLGDNYYHGNGIEQDWTRAAAIYYEAYRERSAEAMFNLGFMHEFGAGVPQDLALAQRFYDMCKHTMPDAALPVALAKTWLALHRGWDWLVPRLPRSLQDSAKTVFVLRPSSVRPGAGLEGVLDGIMPRSLALHWESLGWRAGELVKTIMLAVPAEFMTKDVGDTVLLLGLLVVLWVVLKVRRQRQMAAVVGRAPAAPHAAPPMPAPPAAAAPGVVAGGRGMAAAAPSAAPAAAPAAMPTAASTPAGASTAAPAAAGAATAAAGAAAAERAGSGAGERLRAAQHEARQLLHEAQDTVAQVAVGQQQQQQQRRPPSTEILEEEEAQLLRQYEKREQERLRQQEQQQAQVPAGGSSSSGSACASSSSQQEGVGEDGARRAAAAAAERRAQQAAQQQPSS